MKNYVVYCFLFLLPVWLNAQTAQELFTQGNAAYNGGNYDLAIEKYTLILDQEVDSPALYYNLGNAHYRLGNVAESIFYFEKAHRLSPRDESIRNNRAFAANMTLDAIDELPQTQLEQWQTMLLNRLSLNGWTYLLVFFVWLAFVFLVMYLWTSSIGIKRLFFSLGLLSIFLMGLAWSFTHQKQQALSRLSAVVFSEETAVWAEPNKRSETVFRLHEGTVVELLDLLQGWSKVKIANGAEGWIENPTIRRLDQRLGDQFLSVE